MMPAGRLPRMSPTFLRTWYQRSFTLAGGVRSRQDHPDERHAGLRIALDPVEIGQLLQLLLDLVGDLRLHLGRGRARPGDVHHHHLDGERGILGAAEIEVGVGAGRAEQQDHEQHQRAVRDRPFGQIEALHGVAPRACRLSAASIGADLQAGFELLHAERDDPVAVADAGGDERRVLGEGRDRHRALHQRAALVDHVDQRAGAAIEDRGRAAAARPAHPAAAPA